MSVGPEWEGGPFAADNNVQIQYAATGGGLVLEGPQGSLPPLDQHGPQLPPSLCVQHCGLSWGKADLLCIWPSPSFSLPGSSQGFTNLFVLSPDSSVEADVLRGQGTPISMHTGQVGPFQVW